MPSQTVSGGEPIASRGLIECPDFQIIITPPVVMPIEAMADTPNWACTAWWSIWAASDRSVWGRDWRKSRHW